MTVEEHRHAVDTYCCDRRKTNPANVSCLDMIDADKKAAFDLTKSIAPDAAQDRHAVAFRALANLRVRIDDSCYKIERGKLR